MGKYRLAYPSLCPDSSRDMETIGWKSAGPFLMSLPQAKNEIFTMIIFVPRI